MNIFMQPLAELSEYEEIMKDMKKNTYPIQVTGCVDGQKSQFISCIGQDFKYKVIVAPDEIKANQFVFSFTDLSDNAEYSIQKKAQTLVSVKVKKTE